jgi:hypothetical protein
MPRASSCAFGLVGALAAAIAAQTVPQPLAVIPVDAAGRRYEVSSGLCAHGSCRIVVRLMQGGRELDAQAIETRVPSRAFRPTAFKRANGAGDPLASTVDAQAYSSGQEENSVTLIVRPVKLTRELAGALIDLRFGFEHVKRHHEIFAASGGKLRKIWSAEEGEGPTYSTTALASLADGRQRLVYFSFFNYPDESGPDKLRIEAMAYDDRARKFAPDKAPLKGLFAGPYASIAEARTARMEQNRCRIPFWVLPASEFASANNGFVVVTVSASAGNISRVAGELKSCAAGMSFSSYKAERDSLIMW